MDPVIPEGGYFIMANWSQLGNDALNKMPVLQEIILEPPKKGVVSVDLVVKSVEKKHVALKGA